MLNGVSNHDVNGQNQIKQNEVEKTKLNTRNPYAGVDKNLLVDESDISKEALKMYERDLDIKRFSALAMSDPEDLSHNVLVVNDESFDSKIIEGIFNNKMFLKDLFN